MGPRPAALASRGTCRDAKSPRPADGPSGAEAPAIQLHGPLVNHGPESGSMTMARFYSLLSLVLYLQSLHHHNRYPLCLCCLLSDNVSFRAKTSRVMGVKSLWKSLLLFKRDGAFDSNHGVSSSEQSGLERCYA